MERPLDSQPLHHTRHKFKHLSTSQVLASSLLSQKNRMQDMRREHPDPPLDVQSNVLMSNKALLNLPRPTPLPQEKLKDTSSLLELKSRARILENDHDVFQLGKENCDHVFTRENLGTISEISINKSNKINRRKVVKGRPEMYAIVRKRKMLMAAIEENEEQKGHGGGGGGQRKLSQMVNKNNLLKYLSLKNAKSNNKNLLDAFEACENERSKTTNKNHRDRKALRESLNKKQSQFWDGKVDAFSPFKEMIQKDRKASFNTRKYSLNTIE